jgi:hypothetical protein
MSVLDLQGLQAVREPQTDPKGGGNESQISLLLCIGDDGLSQLSLLLC